MAVQKKLSSIIIAFVMFLTYTSSFAQSQTAPEPNPKALSVSFGYSYTGITFKEIDRLTTNIVNYTFNMKQKYRGGGFHVGLHKNIEEALTIDLSFDSFKSDRFTDQNGPAGGSNRLKGFQIPIMATYLLRDPDRAFNFNLGIGLQYLNASAEQTANGFSGTATSTLSEFKISTGYASFSFGFQYRIVPNLHTGYQARLSVSPNGRSSDNGVFFLRYSVL